MNPSLKALVVLSLLLNLLLAGLIIGNMGRCMLSPKHYSWQEIATSLP